MSNINGLKMQEMIPIELIRSNIEGDLFDYSQLMLALSHYSKPRDTVTSLLNRGHIIRIRKGLYVFGPMWRRTSLTLEPVANLVYGPSAISLDYSLSWYGLIPERVNIITSITTGRSRKFLTPLGSFSYIQLSGSRFSACLQQHGTSKNKFIMAEPLKALADKVWTDKRFKPTSPVSYSDYIFGDLRIDEDNLAGLITQERLSALERAYTSRKILWLTEYLMKRFGGVK